MASNEAERDLVLKLRVVATPSTFPHVVGNGQERIKTTHRTLFSSWI